jgi:hypothetical protein
MSLLEDKLEHLEKLFEEHGDFIIAQIYKGPGDGLVCSKHFKYSESRDNMLKKKAANLRALLADEVLFDFESQDSAYEGIEKLDRDAVSYSAWFTGSRGYHVHSYYPELANYSEQFRQQVRLMLINRYGADPSKKSGLLAIEYTPHFKTRRPKVLRASSGDEGNTLSSELRTAVEKTIAYPPKLVWHKDEYISKLYRSITPQAIFGTLPGFRKVGRSYMMLCPFHADKEPSLAVPIDKPVFHCFGCGAKGDWLKFIMLRDGIGFRDAKRRLEDLAQKGDMG